MNAMTPINTGAAVALVRRENGRREAAEGPAPVTLKPIAGKSYVYRRVNNIDWSCALFVNDEQQPRRSDGA